MVRSVLKLAFVITGWSFVFPILADASVCGVTVGFSDPEVEVSGLLVDVAYDPTVHQPVGSADDVECVGHVDGVLATFNELAEDAVVKAGLVRLEPFGGAALFTCAFDGDPVDPADLVFEVRDATGPDLEPVTPRPTVVVNQIACAPEQGSEADGGDGAVPGSTAGEPAEGSCVLTVTAHSEAPLAGLMYDLYYPGAPSGGGEGAEIAGVGQDVACESLVDGALAAYHDDEDENVFGAAIVHLEGFSGSTPVTRCSVETAGPVSASDFQIVLTEGVDPDGTALVPAPALTLDLACGGEADGDSAAPATGSTGGSSTDDSCGGPFDVTFAVGADTPLSSLQFTIGYAGAPGAFDGEGEGVQCDAVGTAAGAFAMFNDLEAESKVVAGYVSLSPFDTPTDVMRCRFTTSGRAPQPVDFVAYAIEAADELVNQVQAGITVSSITPSADNEGCARCGDGRVDAAEECDDANDENRDACLDDCTWNTCGDGYVHEGVEDCDAGAGNSGTQPDTCRSDCTLPRCGDAVTDSSEQCDDGNEIYTDACLPGCVAPWCGDGVVWDAVETCDDGAANNDADPDACRSDCSAPEKCGDADGNGVITATDAKVVLDNAIGLASTCRPARCDVNGNTSTTATDARTVLNAAVGLAAELDCWLPVVFTFDNESLLGGLQFAVDYSATGSTFVGSGENVYCTASGGDDVLVSFNNDEDAGVLNVALISTVGLQTPAAVAACSFYQPDHDLAPSDFVISIADAVDPEIEPIDDPGMSVQF